MASTGIDLAEQGGDAQAREAPCRPPRAVTSAAATGARSSSSRTTKRIGIAQRRPHARRVDGRVAHRPVDRRLAGDRRVDGRAGSSGRRAARSAACSVLTMTFSDCATEATIIAAVGRGRSAAPVEPASHAESTRVSGRRASARTSAGP